ncbi:YbaY family lipoprotein [Stutzerimonas kirkiae]|uniref:Lipoprotein n=1 Tax=Stutzerimonas kirkiae TaxID=2211392 RepID=A0A4Q9R5E0_9GAMM|nr:YbaY family lipoprotein [Stutzerimonas kirkiae]TBU95746.1 hypothetical protein DNJ96_11755 [Stutzerimonas kirkiae]TBV02737.1 hypothetical protein DNJ95_08655 [Stutzerimonas kirkiae]TBV12260.1 hypothetical protein DNK08_00005 [Stutzerimonas kirkiae]TBV13250.1 hypothetical protein DNK01_12395 [Stutzerimonas kirkiae]
MPLRPIALLGLTLLLTACAGKPPVPEAPAPVPELVEESASELLHQLSGSLLGVPKGADVELALLEVHPRNRPDKLLSSVQLKGRGDALPFILKFNPENFPSDQRVELRGRVTQSGRLIMRLPPKTIHSDDSRALGPLHLVPAP